MRESQQGTALAVRRHYTKAATHCCRWLNSKGEEGRVSAGMAREEVGVTPVTQQGGGVICSGDPPEKKMAMMVAVP